MTTGTTRRDGGVNELAFGFIFVTLNTGRRVGVGLQRYGMDASQQSAGAGKKSPRQYDPHNSDHNCLQPLPQNLCTMIAADDLHRQESSHNQLSLST
jgi:hypothetical protein